MRRFFGLINIVAIGSLASLGGCEEPPPKRVDRVAPPVLERDREAAEQLFRTAHEQALTTALPLALAALHASDPLGAWQAGRGPAALPMLSVKQRSEASERMVAARDALDEINEAYLPPSSVVILRAVEFAITRLAEELDDRPRVRDDPTVPLHAVAKVLDELTYRMLHDDCDVTCESLAADLALALTETRWQLRAASPAATRRSGLMATALAQQTRDLAARPLLDHHASLRVGLEQLASTLDQHRDWLAELAQSLTNAPTRAWTDKPALLGPGNDAHIQKLPDVLGARALSRRLAAEELLILDPERDVSRTADHVRRWHALRRELVGEQVPKLTSKPVDAARCQATLARIRTGLAGVEGIDPPQLDCDRYVDLLGRELDEATLVIELLDYGVIEPQRRQLRNQELAEIAAVSGQWSTDVHTHLRRVMLLARLDEPAARAQAIAEGSRALCLAEASLWVHAELGLPRAVADAIGSKCSMLGNNDAILDLVLGDARGSLAGYGLSLIGDEPARMVGFDRFFWAPLGLMQTLATPLGVHPDQFTLPDDPRHPDPDHAAPSAELDVKIEQLSPTAEQER